jgi:hypothetical protein
MIPLKFVRFGGDWACTGVDDEEKWPEDSISQPSPGIRLKAQIDA